MTTSPARPPWIGPNLRGRHLAGRYQLRDLIAGGGTGRVYAAVDLHLRRRVAVKVILPEHARSDEQRRGIRQEAMLGARLDHPHVMPVFDLGEDAGEAAGGGSSEPLMFLVMPLTRGQSLREVILGGAVPWPRAVELMRQLLSGLAAIHRAGALHRDIKPENCLVSRVDDHDHLRLLDLGLAKPIACDLLSRPPVSIAGALVGTVAYLSPEQAQGLVLDERSDLYAAGVVLFELLTRRPPFGGTHFEILSGHVHGEVPTFAAVAPDAGIPAALEAIVRCALAKRPDERFPTAESFAAALEAIAPDPDAGVASASAGCAAAQAALGAWSRCEYTLAHDEATRAGRINLAWAPLSLLMCCAGDER